MSNTPGITSQLKFNNGQRSKAIDFYLDVLAEFTNDIHLTEDREYSRAAIARYLRVTISQVATAVEWLAGRGYVQLNLNSQVTSLTALGWRVVKSRNGKEKADERLNCR